MNIVFLDTDTIGEVDNLKKLEEFGNLTIYQRTSNDERISRIRGNQIVITNKVIIDKEVMDSCPNLKLICIAATGMNNVDLEYAKYKGIEVKNVSGYSTLSVAQTTFAMLLRIINHIEYFDRYVKNGTYSSSHLFTHHGKNFHQLEGKIWGIIGMGAIGKQVASMATAFGASIIYYSTTGKNLKAGYKHVSLKDLLQNSHIVSIHCPLTPKTKNLIIYAQLQQMRKDAIILNLGRGGIINEPDLARALNDNIIAYAALDVFVQEPLPEDNPLLHIKNPDKIVFTPHIAWASIESRTLLVAKIYQNIHRFISSQS